MSRYRPAIVVLVIAAVGAACADRGQTPNSPLAPGSPTTASRCQDVLPVTSSTTDAVGGATPVVVAAASGCGWRVDTAGLPPWITVNDVESRTGLGAVVLTLQPNRSFQRRSGPIGIRDDRDRVTLHTVVQHEATCLYWVSPSALSTPDFGTYDGSGDSPLNVMVTAEPSDCQWTATPSVSWMRVVYNSGSGTGSRRIYVTVSPQFGPAPARSGTITVAGLSGVNPPAQVSVTQAAR